jgi:hypothetical protein
MPAACNALALCHGLRQSHRKLAEDEIVRTARKNIASMMHRSRPSVTRRKLLAAIVGALLLSKKLG